MKLIVTIDTEEDNWGSYRSTGMTLENITRIPVLQQLFDDYQVKPTYLITYTVATDARSVAILKPILDQERCEIGTHCHPWSTPPFDLFNGESSRRDSMLCNLPFDVQFSKISELHGTIRKNFGIEPASFRSGRWGYNQDVARCLHKLGYRVDTSILPYTDWSYDYGPNYAYISPKPYRFFPETAFEESVDGPLLEIPATIGYLQRDFELCNRFYQRFLRKPLCKLRLAGILHQLGFLNNVWLSPEECGSTEMINLARRMKKNGYPFINFFFHSPTLKAGLTPFVKTKEDEQRFLDRIEAFISFTRDEGIESITLSEAAGSLRTALQEIG